MYGGSFVETWGISKSGSAACDDGLMAIEDHEAAGLVLHDLVDAKANSEDEIGLVDGLIDGGFDDDDAIESREEGANNWKLQFRSFFLQLSHSGWVQSHCFDCQLAYSRVRRSDADGEVSGSVYMQDPVCVRNVGTSKIIGAGSKNLGRRAGASEHSLPTLQARISALVALWGVTATDS
jgi:hypothetical protein